MFILGIELGNDFSQVCYYNFAEDEPVSVNFSADDIQYQVPTVLLREKDKEDNWLAGDVAASCEDYGKFFVFKNLIYNAQKGTVICHDGLEFAPEELIKRFLVYLITTVKELVDGSMPDKVCIAVKEFDKAVLKCIEAAWLMMGMGREKLILTSYMEAFAYYAVSQKKELWNHENVLFDYGKDGLTYYGIEAVPDNRNKIVVSEKKDLRDTVPFMENNDKLGELLTEVAKDIIAKNQVSTFYLTGEGFGNGFSCEGFIDYICRNRRVFAGRNLFVKGACYQAYEEAVGSRFKDIILACNERVTTGVEIKVCDWEKDKIFRMVKPGSNWYNSGCSYDFIVDDAEELEIYLSPLTMNKKLVKKISLSDFPKRDNKMTRINITISFDSDSICRLKVTDKGFGGFAKSSGLVIEEVISV